MSLPPALLPFFTRRLVLREPVFADVPRLARLADDISIARNLRGMPYPFGEREASAFVGDALASNQAGEGLICAIAFRDKPHVLIGIVSFQRRGEAAELGYWISRLQRRKGFAREACMAALSLALQDMRTKRVEAGVFSDNGASLALLAELGFVFAREDKVASLARTQAEDHRWLTLSRAQAEQRLAKAVKQG